MTLIPVPIPTIAQRATLWCLLALLCVVPAGAAVEYSVTAFGARGDGLTDDTDAINAAIQAAAAQGGGATVLFPEGVYRSYSIHLQSAVTLRLDEGAVIKAAPVTDTKGYDDPEPNASSYQDFGHSHWHNSLLWGEDLHDVRLVGSGLIDGTDVLSRGEPRKGVTGPSVANKAVALKNCRKVEIKGLKFRSCGHFALLLTGVDDLLIEEVTIDSNRDGIDIDCCEHVVVRGCHVNTVNDDAIVLKCSYALGWAKPTADVVVEQCHVTGYDVGSLLDGTLTATTTHAPDRDGPTGRIKLGTESNGGFRDIIIRDCTFEHCRGLALETVDGAAMEHIRVSHLRMNDICNSPIYIRLGSRMRGPATLPPSSIHDVAIRDVTVTDADCRYACLIVGEEEHPVTDVTLSDVHIQYRGGVTLADYREQRGTNPFFYHEGGTYPEPAAHGIQPAWGLNIHHARGVTLRRVTFQLQTPDERPMLYRHDTRRLHGRPKQ